MTEQLKDNASTAGYYATIGVFCATLVLSLLGGIVYALFLYVTSPPPGY